MMLQPPLSSAPAGEPWSPNRSRTNLGRVSSVTGRGSTARYPDPPIGVPPARRTRSRRGEEQWMRTIPEQRRPAPATFGYRQQFLRTLKPSSRSLSCSRSSRSPWRCSRPSGTSSTSGPGASGPADRRRRPGHGRLDLRGAGREDPAGWLLLPMGRAAGQPHRSAGGSAGRRSRPSHPDRRRRLRLLVQLAFQPLFGIEYTPLGARCRPSSFSPSRQRSSSGRPSSPRGSTTLRWSSRWSACSCRSCCWRRRCSPARATGTTSGQPGSCPRRAGTPGSAPSCWRPCSAPTPSWAWTRPPTWPRRPRIRAGWSQGAGDPGGGDCRRDRHGVPRHAGRGRWGRGCDDGRPGAGRIHSRGRPRIGHREGLPLLHLCVDVLLRPDHHDHAYSPDVGDGSGPAAARPPAPVAGAQGLPAAPPGRPSLWPW